MVKIRPFAFTSSSWPIAWPKPWFMPWSYAEAAPSLNRSQPERFRSPGYKQFGLSEVVTAEQFFGLALICKKGECYAHCFCVSDVSPGCLHRAGATEHAASTACRQARRQRSVAGSHLEVHPGQGEPARQDRVCRT